MSRNAQKKALKSSKKQTPRQPVQYLILRAIAIGKRLSVNDLVPEIERTLAREDASSSDRKVKPTYVINRTIKKLADDGMLMIEAIDDRQYAHLTKEGLQKFHDNALLTHQGIVSLSWDGMYRFVITNFSATDKNERERVRYVLKKARFIPLSTGVYVSVFPLEHIVTRLQSEYKPGEIIFLKTAEVDPDTANYIARLFESAT
jgi:hypothetical protein